MGWGELLSAGTVQMRIEREIRREGLQSAGAGPYLDSGVPCSARAAQHLCWQNY